jgi:protein-tyrosine phosphatase
MIDLHCHILPGIDDGPPTIEGSVAIAAASAAGGVRTIVATPHVSWDYPNDAATIARLVDEVNERLAAEEIALTVRAGAELAFTRIADIPDEELRRLDLGGGGWLLVEPPFTPAVTGLENVIAGLRARGHQVLLAHPERCPAFHRDRDALVRLAASGVACSITAGSLVGRFGREVRRFTMGLVADGLVHNVASDAHDAVRRPPGMAAELETAGLDGLRAWSTEAVPQAILDGEPLPPRPPEAVVEPPRERRGLRWLRRS